MRVFLTGGTGFIGQALARVIRDRDWQLDALVRCPDGAAARHLASLGTTLIAGDVTQRESMRAAMARADLVIHNAGIYEFGANAALRQRMQAANVDGTDNILGLALELGVPRSVYVSTTLASGATGPQPRDETFVRQQPCLTEYERTKTEAHEIAVRMRERGLSLIIVCPNQVVGPNDHSVFGYLLRMYLLYLLPPLAWNPGTTQSPVHVQALAEGVALAAAKGRIGENYLLCGEPTTLRQLFGLWKPHRGGFVPKLWLPPALMKVMFTPMEPLFRLAGLPAIFSRETVAASTNLNYSSAKAQRELGWTSPAAADMWPRIIERERQLLTLRSGLRAKLRPMETTPGES
jgi:nucleoside-diphosphate-sugar epimerase